MKIEITKAQEMTIEEFADLSKLTMEVEELASSSKEKPRYLARLKPVPDLRSGIGSTPEEAIADYRKRISGTHLSIGVIATPWFAFDQTIKCPRFIEKAEASATQQEPDKYRAALEEIVSTHAGLTANLCDMQKYRYSAWAVAIAKKALGEW